MKVIILLILCVCGLHAQTNRTTYVQHKAAHVIAGLGIAYAGHKMGYPKTGIAVAWSLGLAKELYDKKHTKSFKAGDIAWTGAPATVVSISFKW